jgi:hypothetical protein
MEVSGWAECLLRSVVEQRFTFLDVQLNIALSLTLLDTEDSIGKIVSRTIDRVKMEGNEAAILEKKLAISGFRPGSALSLVFKVSVNRADVTYMCLHVNDGTADLQL